MPRVLVVEDEPNIADFIRRGLVYKGFEVDVAHTGSQGLDAAHRQFPDIVVLDLMLPDMDGVEVCGKLRAADDVPIIMLTARDATSDKIEGLEAGADDYMTKPFEFDELLARIRAALRRHDGNRRDRGAKFVKRVGDHMALPIILSPFRGILLQSPPLATARCW